MNPFLWDFRFNKGIGVLSLVQCCKCIAEYSISEQLSFISTDFIRIEIMGKK